VEKAGELYGAAAGLHESARHYKQAAVQAERAAIVYGEATKLHKSMGQLQHESRTTILRDHYAVRFTAVFGLQQALQAHYDRCVCSPVVHYSYQPSTRLFSPKLELRVESRILTMLPLSKLHSDSAALEHVPEFAFVVKRHVKYLYRLILWWHELAMMQKHCRYARATVLQSQQTIYMEKWWLQWRHRQRDQVMKRRISTAYAEQTLEAAIRAWHQLVRTKSQHRRATHLARLRRSSMLVKLAWLHWCSAIVDAQVSRQQAQTQQRALKTWQAAVYHERLQRHRQATLPSTACGRQVDASLRDTLDTLVSSFGSTNFKLSSSMLLDVPLMVDSLIASENQRFVQ
jgi:hypothetical protein